MPASPVAYSVTRSVDWLLCDVQRVSHSNNSEFLDMMEKYFEKPLDQKVRVSLF